MDVTIGCLCPPKANGEPRHQQDTVTLPDILDFRRTVVVRQSIGLGYKDGSIESLPDMVGLLIEAYVLNCIDAWTLVDDHNKPVPLSRQAIREHLLTNFEAAEKVGDAADNLYTEKVILPLLMRASPSLPATPMPVSTSATNGHGPKARKPSRRSSTTSSPMVATVTTVGSPDGASSYSQS